MVSGAHNYDDFLALLRRLEPALQLSIKDLRSQVVREACISASLVQFTCNLIAMLFNGIQ